MILEWVGYLMVGSVAIGIIVGAFSVNAYLRPLYDREIDSLSEDRDAARECYRKAVADHQATLKKYGGSDVKPYNFDSYNPAP